MSDAENWDQVMGDETEWEEPRKSQRKKSERRQRGAMVSVRLTPAELEEIQLCATAAGLSVGAYMRQQALLHRAPLPTGAAAYVKITGLEQIMRSGSIVEARVPAVIQRWESANA